MTDEANWCVMMLREGACCSYCAIAFPTIDYPYPCEERTKTNSNMCKAADLIESLSTELEQVKRERDAAVEDICKAAITLCDACAHHHTAFPCFKDEISDETKRTIACNRFEWRGMKGAEVHAIIYNE